MTLHTNTFDSNADTASKLAARVDVYKRRIDSMLDVINDLTASNTSMRTFIADMGLAEVYAAWSEEPAAEAG